tara:strand:- start:355 stop:2082 length:1728 start_codon:yes stop_codon:yes gene_type:complete
MAISKIKTGSITDSAITSAKISDGTIVNADVSPSAAIAASKTVICTAITDANAFNISLLGFKMAVNEGLTVFNLVDGVVDEFHDESGTDESEGSNDLYNATDDYYINSTRPDGSPVAPVSISAGFTTTTITEPDTSTGGTNPDHGCGSYGAFTVPCGVTSLSAFLWGAGGGSPSEGPAPATSSGGGGGFTTGTIGVTPGQVLDVVVGEGAYGNSTPGYSQPGMGSRRPLGGGGYNYSAQGLNTAGGGASILFNTAVSELSAPQLQTQGACASSPYPAPGVVMVAAGGGGGGYAQHGGAGGGLTGDRGGQAPGGGGVEQTDASAVGGSAPTDFRGSGGGGDQEQGGQGNPDTGSTIANGGFLLGGSISTSPGPMPNAARAAGGGGYYGGGGSFDEGGPHGAGGGGSSYYGHPQITSGSTEEGDRNEGGGITQPNYQSGTNESQPTPNPSGAVSEDGYVLLTATVAPVTATATSTTIISTAFSATSVPTSSRIVVFEENVDTPTLNTDIIASISRDGGSTFTTATLTDSGYVTGSSGQRILTGQATISGQPSGQSMRWKLALANNQVKIHGVSLQWS